jgi:hypothetical protein
VSGRIRSIEKSTDLIGNWTPNLLACIIVPQPTTLLCAEIVVYVCVLIIIWTGTIDLCCIALNVVFIFTDISQFITHSHLYKLSSKIIRALNACEKFTFIMLMIWNFHQYRMEWVYLDSWPGQCETRVWYFRDHPLSPSSGVGVMNVMFVHCIYTHSDMLAALAHTVQGSMSNVPWGKCSLTNFLRIVQSSELQHCVVWGEPDVLQEYVTSIFRVEE